MIFSMTANVQYTVEQRRLLRNSHCLSASSDSFYLQFKPTIWAQSYSRKHQLHYQLQERHFPTPLRTAEKQQFYWNWTTVGAIWWGTRGTCFFSQTHSEHSFAIFHQQCDRISFIVPHCCCYTAVAPSPVL